MDDAPDGPDDDDPIGGGLAEPAGPRTAASGIGDEATAVMAMRDPDGDDSTVADPPGSEPGPPPEGDDPMDGAAPSS